MNLSGILTFIFHSNSLKKRIRVGLFCLELENIDYQECLTYICLNTDKVSDLGEIANFLPVRAFKYRRTPGMKEQIKGPHHQKAVKEEEQKWVHQSPPVSRRLKRKILGKVVKIGIITLFTMFVYSFGGELYWQKAGAPIGTRVSCAAANLVTE